MEGGRGTAVERRLNLSDQLTDRSRRALWEKYRHKAQINPALRRSLVSYQSNRNRPYYRWFKYKEGFSAALVEYVLNLYAPHPGVILDPFAGSGAALFASRDRGWRGTGIELLPVGVFAIRTRLAAERTCWKEFREAVKAFQTGKWRKEEDPKLAFRHLRITRGAFPTETERDLARYRTYVRDQFTNPNIQRLMDAACFSMLETVSYTRKDGQYLRWDERAPRNLPGAGFNKGPIIPLDRALDKQLAMMLEDVGGFDLFSTTSRFEDDRIQVLEGSCLTLLPDTQGESFDLVLTSPPYCNRYDYTRTYALELAYLGLDGSRIKELRQSLLSCTVENRTKADQLRHQYQVSKGTDLFQSAVAAFEDQEALQEILSILEYKNREGTLNNANVPRMVRNYFLESAVVIFELRRGLRPGGRIIMVNDNVQYAGEEIPVDLILCDLASKAGLVTECIWTLGRGKGNSSQQMGTHGRNELRKCAYVWRLDG